MWGATPVTGSVAEVVTLRDNNPGLPASSTYDDYWAGQAAWYQSRET
jgi:hypothetical protein